MLFLSMFDLKENIPKARITLQQDIFTANMNELNPMHNFEVNHLTQFLHEIALIIMRTVKDILFNVET